MHSDGKGLGTAVQARLRRLEIAQGFTPDVALIDIGLPGIDGFQLAQHLRELPAL
ncbi:hypothetical protein [Cupriavidus sp. YAF13]|uniref:hypothetical protein n=1 Tax=Cupriavidus sp. YAF13 TaxID=3233075 RepID=UPI003F922EFB